MRRYTALRRVRTITCSSLFSSADSWDGLALSAIFDLGASHTLAAIVRPPGLPAFESESVIAAPRHCSVGKMLPHAIPAPLQSAAYLRSKNREDGRLRQ